MIFQEIYILGDWGDILTEKLISSFFHWKKVKFGEKIYGKYEGGWQRAIFLTETISRTDEGQPRP